MPPSRNAAVVERQTFLDGLRASGVVAEPHLDRALNNLPPSARTARDIAEHLVSADAITRFQAERLLSGRADGFQVGPYVILEHLGKSATGRVFKARHRTMNRLVAIKLLASELTSTDDIREAVRCEAREAAKLTHPNLVTLLDVNQAGDRMYFVREYLDGATVGAVVREKGRLTTGQAGDVIRQAALGLQHAHEKGVAHGRLSPLAVILCRPGRNNPTGRGLVKVSDFGLSRFAAEVESRTDDFEYRAPEQFADADRADPAGDVYALGCVFFHLLAGQPPFPATTAHDAGHQHRFQPVPHVGFLRPEVPTAMAALLVAMLAKEPARRPTAEEVSARLSAYANCDSADAVDLNLPTVTPSISASMTLTRQPSVVPVLPLPADEPSSPFENLNTGTDVSARTPVAVPTPKARRRPAAKPRREKLRTPLHPLTVVSVLLLIAFGVAFALVVMMRKATASG